MPGLFGVRIFFSDSLFCSYVVSVCSSLARGRIEDSSFNRLALIGIQRDFFEVIFTGGIFVGGILSGYRRPFLPPLQNDEMIQLYLKLYFDTIISNN